MKRFVGMIIGMVMGVGLLVVPSYATSSTPSYPSGNFSNYAGSWGGNLSWYTSSNFYTAVTSGLTNGFSMVGNGLKSISDYSNTMNSSLSYLRSALIGSAVNFSYRHLGTIGTGLSEGTYYSGSALEAINENLYYGFQSLFNGLGTIRGNITTMDGHITTMDGHVTSGFSTVGSKIDTNGSNLVNFLKSEFEYNEVPLYLRLFYMDDSLYKIRTGLNGFDSDYPIYSFDLSGDTSLSDFEGSIQGGFPMIHRWANVFYNMLFDPADDKLKDETEDQKNELLDEFYGDDSKGVQAGQIGSLGDISSSAGDLFDTGGNVGNVFSEIGNSGSSVWSWFSTDNSNAINGSGGPSMISDGDGACTPSPEIVDFYGAQREEFFSLLGGG